jgi:ABC-2 type transport system permease protein
VSTDSALHAPHSALAGKLRTWWIILRICLEERLVYRGDFMLGTLMRFLPVVTQVFLWTAVFSSISGKTIAGWTRDDMLAYYLLTMVARAFSSMPTLASGIARSIRDGSIKKFLIQPVDMIGYLFLSRVAHKLVYYTVAIFPFALVFFLCRGFFTNGWPEMGVIFVFIWSLMMAFLLGFFLEATIGMLGFWLLEVSSLLFVYMLFSFFLSGHMFPIDMLDEFNFIGGITWGDIVRVLPLQYLAYFPSAVFLEKITGPELTRGLIVQFAWVMFFAVAARWSFNRGLRRYSAFGG